jgi:hypothetical protein
MPIVKTRRSFSPTVKGSPTGRYHHLRRVPTDLEKQGDFSKSGFPIYDFSTQRRDPPTLRASSEIRSPAT